MDGALARLFSLDQIFCVYFYRNYLGLQFLVFCFANYRFYQTGKWFEAQDSLWSIKFGVVLYFFIRRDALCGLTCYEL